MASAEHGNASSPSQALLKHAHVSCQDGVSASSLHYAIAMLKMNWHVHATVASSQSNGC